MSGLVVNDETIRLNNEAVILAGMVRRVINDSADMWKEIQNKLDQYAKMQQELGELRYRLEAKEKELREAVERG